jgi:hypothetical protein
MSWPDFLFLGAPRSGTTQLYEGLRQHPAIFMSEVKEPLYFVSATYRLHRTASASAYQALFKAALPGQVKGEASTLYLFDPEAPRRIHEELPHARLIAILRQPADRAYSQYVFERLLEREPAATFEAALAAEARRLQVHQNPFLFYTQVGRYAGQVRRYLDLFDPSQMLWLLQDDLWRDQAGTFRRIFEFLGVDPAFVPHLEQRVNMSGVPRHRSLYQWLHWGARPLKNWLPGHWVNGLRGQADRTLLRAAPRMAPETRQRLQQAYRDDIEETGRLIGRDLSAWLR